MPGIDTTCSVLFVFVVTIMNVILEQGGQAT